MSIVSNDDYQLGIAPSKIREIFEFGLKRKKEVGEDNVFDFSIGNPTISAPKELNETLIKLIQTENDVTIHGYSSTRGDNELKAKIIKNVNETYGTNFLEKHIFITCGAAPALTATTKALVSDPSNEIIILCPFFPEYKVFTKASKCKLVVVPADIPDFQINFSELEKVINANTKAIIINSPNNPCGSIYTEETLKKLSELLKKKEQEFNTHIYIISDEPYREILFDNYKYPAPCKFYDNLVICYSFSKSMSIPGERVGYTLVNPNAYEADKIIDAIAGAARMMGHVCAPTLMQRALCSVIGKYSDMKEYEKNRDTLYNGLKELGYETNFPHGSFYMFLKCLEDNSENFCMKARDFDILIVPADGFGVPGYCRIAFCVKNEMIVKSLEAFKKLKELYDSKK